MDQSAREYYKKQQDRINASIHIITKSINIYSLLRLVTIIVGGVLIFNLIQRASPWFSILSIVTVLFVFIWLVFNQSKLNSERDVLFDEQLVNQNEINLMQSSANIYGDGMVFQDNEHPYAADLDLFGPASIYQLVCRTATVGGSKLLAESLSAPADQKTVYARQEAVQELADDIDWCQRIQTALLFNQRDGKDYNKSLQAYFRQSIPAFGGKVLQIYTSVAPFLLLTAIVIALLQPTFSRIPVYLVLLNILLCLAYAGKVSKVSNGIGKMGATLYRFAEVFELVELKEWNADLNRTVRKQFIVKGKDQSVSQLVKDLGGLINKLDYRLNILIGTVLNATMLWDIRQVSAIAKWRTKNQHLMENVIDELAIVELLICFAKLQFNHPDWVYPELAKESENVFETTGIKHPLIPYNKSVANDYAMGDHHIALITGSNMAGKSTFLRTVGINIALGLAGAPVCATYLKLSVLELVSYMRIKDNLQESTSTFKAELNRLQTILSIVKRRPNAFFLIDEMLRGTNSVDKYLGSKAVIEKLISFNGTGIVATHDLELAKLTDNYSRYVKNYHFDIQVEGEEMLFDYRLKDGPCTIFNASILLRKIGIDI